MYVQKRWELKILIMLSEEEIEKGKEILSKFMNNEMQRDKLEIDCRCGGWKIGDVYKHLELNPAIKNLLQYIDQLEKYLESISKQLDNVALNQIPIGIKELQEENNEQNKIIDEMANIIKDCDIDCSDICKYRIVRSCEKAPNGCRDCVKQYFEKKVEGK